MQIPNNIEDAVLGLKGLGELMTAQEWQRAAIVWAFTYEGKNQYACSDVSRHSLSQFAKLEIAGLASRNTILKYRKAWALAIAEGHATDVKPGDLIDLPDVEWKPYFNPPKPKPDRTPAIRKKGLPEWDEAAWDKEAINFSPRLVKMSEIMFDTLDGVEDDALKRIAQSIIDLLGDENKARGMARMMHSVIEFTSSYKTSKRA